MTAAILAGAITDVLDDKHTEPPRGRLPQLQPLLAEAAEDVSVALEQVAAAAVAAGHVVNDEDDRSDHWLDDEMPPSPSLLAQPTSTWSPAIVRYLTDHGLTVRDVVDTLGAMPSWVVGTYGGAPASQHQMYGPIGPEPLLWTLTYRSGEYAKFAGSGSGHAISVAAPGGSTQMAIATAKKFAIAEGPFKAVAIAIATGMHAIAGHGVAFGGAAWDTLLHLVGGTRTKRRLSGRKIYFAPDAGDMRLGHAEVAHAVGRIVDDAIVAGAKIHLVLHDAPTQKYDLNDLARDHGPAAIQAAVDNARYCVRYHATPTKSVRQGRAVELLKTIVACQGKGGRLFRSGHVVYDRAMLAEAAIAVRTIAPSLTAAPGLIPTLAPLRDPNWCQSLAGRYSACGTGWGSSRDRRNDVVVRRRPCNAPGCVCGVRRAQQRVLGALSRLAAITSISVTHHVLSVVRPLGAGPRDRTMGPRHLDLLADAQTAFAELRAAKSVTGAMAWQRTEARYALWEGVVAGVVVGPDPLAVHRDLRGWIVRDLGMLGQESRRGLASWLASYAAWRLAPEMGVADRAHCLVDEYAYEFKGSHITGILHGNAISALERRQLVDATRYGADDCEYLPPARCVCGELLRHGGACDPLVLREQQWTPRRQFWIAGPFGSADGKWLDRAAATEAAGARAFIEALAVFAPPVAVPNAPASTTVTITSGGIQ